MGSPTCSSRPRIPQPTSPEAHATSRWWPCSGLLGLRILEATGADIAGLGEAHGHWVLHVCAIGT